MFLIDGNFRSNISADDRSIHFGDGSFTTARIIKGKICLYNKHIHRLKEACKKLFIPFTQWNTLKNEMKCLASNINRGILKVIISRGSGNRGYSIDTCINPRRILSVSPYPRKYDRWRSSGIKLSLSSIRLSRNPILAGIKHLNRLEQILIHSNMNRLSNADETIVLDTEDFIVECCSANLFWRCGKYVFTPTLDQSGVNGIMRQFCLEQLMNSPFYITEVKKSIKALYRADEVIICNAVIPIAPVRAYKNCVWISRDLYNFLFPLCDKA